MFSTSITAREGGGFLVERRWNGVTTEKYKIDDLKQHPGVSKLRDGRKNKRMGRNVWLDRVVEIANQPSVNIVIEVPPMPTLEMTQAEKLAAFEQVEAYQLQVVIRPDAIQNSLDKLVEKVDEVVASHMPEGDYMAFTEDSKNMCVCGHARLSHTYSMKPFVCLRECNCTGFITIHQSNETCAVVNQWCEVCQHYHRPGSEHVKPSQRLNYELLYSKEELKEA
jgi:hypothetical protein